MATDVRTMNLSDNGDGMVSLNNNQGTSFVPNIPPEKNVSENKQTMDSTSISDIMGQAEEPLEPPMMGTDPRMTQMHMQAPMMMAQQQPVGQNTNEKKSELLVAYSQYSTALEELLSTVFDIQKDLKDILKEQSSLIADSRKKTSKPKTKSKKK